MAKGDNRSKLTSVADLQHQLNNDVFAPKVEPSGTEETTDILLKSDDQSDRSLATTPVWDVCSDDVFTSFPDKRKGSHR
jgi:hypothetical protein